MLKRTNVDDSSNNAEPVASQLGSSLFRSSYAPRIKRIVLSYLNDDSGSSLAARRMDPGS